MGKLYIVGTPIGNLEDITLRAVRVLGEVDVIFAEDTRQTKKLLSRYEIETPTERYDEHSHGEQSKKVLTHLESGEDVALVSDSGTPAISDPGARLVRAAREAGHEVITIPGPSALTAALSVAGVPASEFLFLGFPPHKKGRETFFKLLAAESEGRTVVFYESPHRILKTLKSLADHIGERQVTLARELTKIHEEVVTGVPKELIEHLGGENIKVKGEFVVICSPKATRR